ncbi:Ig-like domain-containing protein [Nocardioides sp. AX2bis]|uniref:Ig-like domain-containing protein n=1 Tax=Nocardioides sp. AX2bis TaxID=2653157 RepID=UPI001356CA45|nr:Ig-like domain-containing protein [Nocardioides sp. AX2bis]
MSTGLVALGATTPAQAAQAAGADQVAVSDATLTWDLNDEATSGAFAPGTWNLMSAGRVDDPGAGGTTLRAADGGATWSNGEPAGWSAQEGDVTVEDLAAGGSYDTATFAGTRTNSAGANANTSGVRGETRLSFGAGTGTVDPEAGTASISWDGDATLLAYSGMTFFYVSDPQLDVAADGSGTVSATVGGYATEMDDPTAWEPLPETEVTLAALQGVEVTADGVEATPAYRQVAYEAPTGATAQARTGTEWGAFPQDFVDFQQSVGQGSYWYSSGGAADVRKVANPLAVSWTGDDVPAAPTVTVSDTDLLPSGAQEITVEGTGFDPAAVPATRPPLAGGSGGVYVAVGKFAEQWQPSTGAPSSARKTTDVDWAVEEDDVATIGGADRGAIVLSPEGGFTATLRVDKDAIDAAATDPSLTRYGIYTYPGGGASDAAYETATPLTFTKAAPEMAVSAPRASFGEPASAVVTVTSEGDTSGAVTLRRGGSEVGTADVTDGEAAFDLGLLGAGRYPLTASYTGNAQTADGTATTRLVVARATTTTTAALTRTPTPKRAGTVRVGVASPTTDPTGRAVVKVKQGNRVVSSGRAPLRDGVATVRTTRLPQGRYQVVATYTGTPNIAGSTDRTRFRVRR